MFPFSRGDTSLRICNTLGPPGRRAGLAGSPGSMPAYGEEQEHREMALKTHRKELGRKKKKKNWQNNFSLKMALSAKGMVIFTHLAGAPAEHRLLSCRFSLSIFSAKPSSHQNHRLKKTSGFPDRDCELRSPHGHRSCTRTHRGARAQQDPAAGATGKKWLVGIRAWT